MRTFKYRSSFYERIGDCAPIHWKQVANFNVLVNKGAISSRDLDLF